MEALIGFNRLFRGCDYNELCINETSGLSGCVIVRSSLALLYGTSRKAETIKDAVQGCEFLFRNAIGTFVGIHGS